MAFGGQQNLRLLPLFLSFFSLVNIWHFWAYVLHTLALNVHSEKWEKYAIFQRDFPPQSSPFPAFVPSGHFLELKALFNICILPSFWHGSEQKRNRKSAKIQKGVAKRKKGKNEFI
jgi:hypothetical protein